MSRDYLKTKTWDGALHKVYCPSCRRYLKKNERKCKCGLKIKRK